MVSLLLFNVDILDIITKNERKCEVMSYVHLQVAQARVILDPKE